MTMNADDDFFAALETQFDEPDTGDAVDFTKLSDLEIATMFGDIRQDLIDTNQMMVPSTEEGRHLHSQRTALLVEMAKRGMR